MTLPMSEQKRSLAPFTTLGIGGPAEHYSAVQTVEEMQLALKYCSDHGCRFFILGKGSNTLFDSRGFEGMVIHNKIDFYEENAPGVIHVGAGYSFSLLGSQTARKGWSGLEFASGIPGSVGGAVFMNAGANGSETCNALQSVDFVNHNGIYETITKDKLSFGYRQSSFQSCTGAIVGATFALIRSEEAKTKQRSFIDYRIKTQPYSDKSAGCMFRNPKEGSAGALIEQCGLKGMRIGGAMVSTLHANFVINTGNGSSDDILNLVNHIKTIVKQKTGIDLESEVRYIHDRIQS